ncbi:hypothetical protein HPB50_010826 [Hyalomma asiaticum]|uniref:Uncharacterized protein n=1 Tax=Hyalomma asiaticum TaxID=266040 RepID=A0ACB7RRK4_HYAAI|nr:hypothetical protein HPB50_010826 [Hyalomma asiaticum]
MFETRNFISIPPSNCSRITLSEGVPIATSSIDNTNCVTAGVLAQAYFTSDRTLNNNVDQTASLKKEIPESQLGAAVTSASTTSNVAAGERAARATAQKLTHRID